MKTDVKEKDLKLNKQLDKFLIGKKKEVDRLFLITFKRKAPVSYYTRDDKKEIMGWSKTRCKKIIKQLVNAIMFENTAGLEIQNCAWCILFYDHCGKCNYGKRHGRCSTRDGFNDYEILDKVSIYITNNFYRELCNKCFGENK